MIKRQKSTFELRLAENFTPLAAIPAPLLQAEERRALEHPHGLPTTDKVPCEEAFSDDDVADLVETDGRLPQRLDEASAPGYPFHPDETKSLKAIPLRFDTASSPRMSAR